MFTIFESILNFWKRTQLHIFWKFTHFLETYTIFGNVQSFTIQGRNLPHFFSFSAQKNSWMIQFIPGVGKGEKSFIDSVDTRRAKILWIPTYTMVSLKDGACNLWHDMSCFKPGKPLCGQPDVCQERSRLVLTHRDDTTKRAESAHNFPLTTS